MQNFLLPNERLLKSWTNFWVVSGRKVRVERTIRLRIPALYGPLMVHPRSAAQEYHVKWGQNITILIQNLKCVILLEYGSNVLNCVYTSKHQKGCLGPVGFGLSPSGHQQGGPNNILDVWELSVSQKSLIADGR